MVAYREPDGFERTTMILASLAHEVRVQMRRRKLLMLQIIVFAAIFLVLLTGETLFATLMFSIIQVEILGTVVTGAAFALLVPTVIGYAHVRLHHEGDHFTRWWLGRLSGIGILVFALGMSTMIGFSAWQAARDSVSALSSGPTGMLGRQDIGGHADATSDIASWIAVIPNSLLFLGLSFGMIITIAFASFCLGRALQAGNILALTSPVGTEVAERIEAAKAKIAAFRRLRDVDTAARRKLPFDVKAKFAREAAHAGWKAGQARIAGARRLFDPLAKNDPLAALLHDPAAGTIPHRFTNEDDYARHMADQMDTLRVHNILRVLSGLPEAGKE